MMAQQPQQMQQPQQQQAVADPDPFAKFKALVPRLKDSLSVMAGRKLHILLSDITRFLVCIKFINEITTPPTKFGLSKPFFFQNI